MRVKQLKRERAYFGFWFKGIVCPGKELRGSGVRCSCSNHIYKKKKKKPDSDECLLLLCFLSPLQPRGPDMGSDTHSEQIFLISVDAITVTPQARLPGRPAFCHVGSWHKPSWFVLPRKSETSVELTYWMVSALLFLSLRVPWITALISESSDSPLLSRHRALRILCFPLHPDASRLMSSQGCWWHEAVEIKEDAETRFWKKKSIQPICRRLPHLASIGRSGADGWKGTEEEQMR